MKVEVVRESTLFKNFMCLFLAVLGLLCCEGLSLVVATGADSPFVVRGLLTAVASLVVEHSLQGARASVVEACGLSSAAPGL